MALRVRTCIHTYIRHRLDMGKKTFIKWRAASVASILDQGAEARHGRGKPYWCGVEK